MVQRVAPGKLAICRMGVGWGQRCLDLPVALVAIIIAVSSLKKQESIHRSDLSLRRSEMSHQTFLEMDRLFHELFKKDVNLQDSEQVVNFLNFTERVGYYVRKGLLDKELADLRWGQTIRLLDSSETVNSEFHEQRCVFSNRDAWVETEKLVQTLRGSSAPVWDWEYQPEGESDAPST